MIYKIQTGKRYFFDIISNEIESTDLQSLYDENLFAQKIKKGNPFNLKKINEERKRLISLFKDYGIYNFEQSSIKFFASIDSSGKDKSIPLKILIENRKKRINDSLKKISYNKYKLKEVNLFINSNNNDTTFEKYS